MYKSCDKFDVVSDGYAFTCKGSFDIHTDANNLKIRIPT